MTYLTILEKLQIFLDMILDSKILLVFIGIIIILSILNLLKVINNKKYILLLVASLLISLVVDISINYKSLSVTFDNFMNIFFTNIYFPSIYVYIGILVINLITFIISIFNINMKKGYKIINTIIFILNNIFLIIILNVVAENSIDIFSIESLYTNKNLVGILELNVIVFLLWIASLLVMYTVEITSTAVLYKKEKSNSVEEDTEYTYTPVEDNYIYNPQLQNAYPYSSPVLQDNYMHNSVESTINNNIEYKNIVEEENNNIPINLNNNIIANQTIIIDNKEINNIEDTSSFTLDTPTNISENINNESFQDIVNDIREESIIIKKPIKEEITKVEEIAKTEEISKVEEVKDIEESSNLNTMELEKISKIEENTNNNTVKLEELIREENKTNNIELQNNVVESREEIKENLYNIEDYKKIITMLNSLKKITSSSNISIDEAVTLSLINNYSVDDCIRFKEILESNLN